MHINSRLFGEIDVDDNKIITFESGIIGFDECRHFTLLYDSEKGNQRSIMWLQSVERPELAFPVADPMSIS
ncbi:MAG: flagellar assembly protein FliW, partial [Butyrivibrio sp.]